MEFCLVTGATGALGPVLIEELLAHGYPVRALGRASSAVDVFPSSVDIHAGDLGDREAIRRAVAGVETVFHLAAKLHIPNPTEQMRAEYQRVNVEGTRVLVEEAQAAGVRRLVFFSTVSVYGPTGRETEGERGRVGERVDEGAVPGPDTVYAETKRRAEEIVLAARNRDGEPLGVVLRMAAVYGPRMKGNYVSLARALAKGRFLPVGNGSNLRTLVYDRDAVRAAILAAGHPAAAGRVYNVSDGNVHSLSEIVAAICEALGKRPPGLSVPLPAARAAAAVVDTAMSLAGRPRRLVAAVDKLVESVAVSSERIQRELGFRPEYDLRRGWRETVTAWKANKADHG